MKCRGLRPDGGHCKVEAKKGGWCRFHDPDPDAAKARAASAQKGVGTKRAAGVAMGGSKPRKAGRGAARPGGADMMVAGIAELMRQVVREELRRMLGDG